MSERTVEEIEALLKLLEQKWGPIGIPPPADYTARRNSRLIITGLAEELEINREDGRETPTPREQILAAIFENRYPALYRAITLDHTHGWPEVLAMTFAEAEKEEAELNKLYDQEEDNDQR